MPKPKQTTWLSDGRVQKYKPQGKAKGKGKGKGKGPQNSYPTKPKKPQPYKKERLVKDGQCHHCKEEGHWKRNCSVYLAELMKKKKKTRGQMLHPLLQLTPPYTPQHNGVSERRNRTLLNMVRSMMSLATLPLSFWDYALESAARILNMVPTKKVDKTPYEIWHGKVPNLSYLKVWGCEAHVKHHTPDKLQQRFVKCIFIGYPKETMDYYFYYPPENKIVVERYADFLEKDFILQKESGRIVELEDEDILPSENTSEHLIEEEIKEHNLGDLNEPVNYKAALSDPEFEKWLVAMNAEMQSMYDNKVWRLVVLPPNEKVVKNKWIYKKKTHIDGKVHIYKARLVAKGYTQTYGVDYEETFSHVADIRAISILIAIAAYYDYEIFQMDFKTMFLNGFLDEEIYMEQPEGFIDSNHPRKNSGEAHWTVVKSILKYLRNTKDTLLVYGGDPEAELRVNCYCDVGFKTDRDNTKSKTGYVFVLNRVPSNDYPIKMNYDNSAAIIMAKESGIQKGARHFKRKYHYVCECIETGKIDIVKVHTDDNLADPFTKALANPKLTRHARSMGLRPACSFM
nr:retrotransposon protein, putative, Ty1-copia subclass [Tanacetum cinerariifolium]